MHQVGRDERFHQRRGPALPVRAVAACVQRLRAKIEDVPAAPVYVRTVRGFGCRFGPL
ncbi:hypothetical protein GCM10017788_06400 [Amycolatopsis acidiphila]|nr:hypothetical protein GCM10017788_06400 [Amycolatopsis acidiphila]